MVNADSSGSSGSVRLIAWFSAIALWTAGCAIIAVGMAWIPFPPKSLHVPRWIVALTGLAFAMAGFPLLAARLGRYTRVSQAAALVVFASLAVIANWVAFGPGPRQFSGGISVGGFVFCQGSSSEMGGRVMFGIGAGILDLIVVAVLASRLRGKS